MADDPQGARTDLRRRRALPVALALLAALAFLARQEPARAHEFYEGGQNIKIQGCAYAGKYGCFSFYMDPRVDGYGPNYFVRHSHTCTDRAGESSPPALWYIYSHAVFSQGNIVWYHDHRSWHSTQWCGQSFTSHEFFPNVRTQSGSNEFWTHTIAEYFCNGTCGPIRLECRLQVRNVTRTVTDGTYNGEPWNVSIDPECTD